MSINKKHYAYQHFYSALKGWKTKLKDDNYSRALRKLNFVILGEAWVDYDLWDENTDRPLALSYAWEDMIVAFCGHGNAMLTGAVIALWSTVPKDLWPEFKDALNQARLQADAQTANTVPRRYLHKIRQVPIRSPDQGYTGEAVTPTWGPRLRAWASLNGKDPNEMEAQFRLIEEYERLGLIDLNEEATGTDDAPVPEPEPTSKPKAAPVRGHLKLVRNEET